MMRKELEPFTILKRPIIFQDGIMECGKKTKEKWKKEGWNGDASVFRYDQIPGGYVRQPLDLGGCESPVMPHFKEEIVKVTDKYEYVRLYTGEVRMYPIGIRDGVMPIFAYPPVECLEDWHKKIKPRLNPETPERWIDFDKEMLEIKDIVDKGERLHDAEIIGGYMFLRNLLGPKDVMYTFYDNPDLIHDMMKTWLHFMVSCLVRIQDRVPLFRLYFDEDISFKTGSLISPEMINKFLMPYYRELIQTLRNRQKDFMHVELDTDGNPVEILPLYIKNGFTAWCPCEVAAGCDVVEMGKKYPELIITGGIDKRILADNQDAIRRELNRIIPVMKERGGYVPTCDHSISEDISFKNYLFYREYLTSIDAF